jgi:EPS-associated MarR family transcriptional regulator
MHGMPVLTEPQRLELLKLLHEQPQLSQRDLARAMGVSLGKANYCLKALMAKGLVKFGNFRRNPDKLEYAYLLTPAGLEEKTRITMAFLRRKVAEYEALEREIEQLRGELAHRQIQSGAPSRAKVEDH